MYRCGESGGARGGNKPCGCSSVAPPFPRLLRSTVGVVVKVAQISTPLEKDSESSVGVRGVNVWGN